jgi:hypothetical protein
VSRVKVKERKNNLLHCWPTVFYINVLNATPWRHIGERRFSSTLLDLGTRWRWVVRITPCRFIHGERAPRHPLDGRLSGPQSQSGRYGEQKSCSCGESNPGLPAHRPSLHRLSYPGCYNLNKRLEIRSPRSDVIYTASREGRCWWMVSRYELISIKQNIYCFLQYNNSSRGIEINVYIKAINLKGITCFDTYWVIIRCRLVLRFWTCTQYGSIFWVVYVLHNLYTAQQDATHIHDLLEVWLNKLRQHSSGKAEGIYGAY